MIRNLISMITFIKKCYSKKDSKKMWMDVPTICKDRIHKDEIIYSIIDFLEHNIKIKNNE